MNKFYLVLSMISKAVTSKQSFTDSNFINTMYIVHTTLKGAVSSYKFIK